jgi:hypothetical protein
MKDKLFIFKKAYSMEAPGHYYEAVLTDAAGFIKKTLSPPEAAELRRIPNSEFAEVDFSDYYCLPGFFDSHTHMMSTGYNSMAVRFEHCRSIDEICDLLAMEIDKNKTAGAAGKISVATAFGSLVAGHGFDETNLTEKRMPRRSELDSVSREVPIFISRVDHHSCVFNGAFVDLFPAFFAGLDKSVIETGILTQAPNYEIKGKLIAGFDFGVRRKAYEAAEKTALEAGVTSLCALEGGAISGAEDVFFIDKVLRDKINKINLILFSQSADFSSVEFLGLPRIGGCLLVDGSFGSKTAALSSPYENDGGNRGALYLNEDFLVPFIEKAGMKNLQAAFHAIGDTAIKTLLDSYEKVFKKSGGRLKNHLRHRIEHFELASGADIKRAADMGVVLSMQPVFETLWGGASAMYAERLGAQRAVETNRFNTIIKAGGIIAGGSDSDVTPISPLAGISALLNLPNESERVSSYDAVSIFTINGAYANFMERTHGSIAVNKRADFTVIDKDIFNAAPSEIKDIKIAASVVGGEVKYRAEEAARRI